MQNSSIQQRSAARFGALQLGIIILGLFTAVVHLTLNFPDVMFILNGLGYLGLLAALYLPLPFFRTRRRLVRWALMGYTALTIILWAIMGNRTTLAFADKAAEVIMLALLYIEDRQSGR